MNKNAGTGAEESPESKGDGGIVRGTLKKAGRGAGWIVGAAVGTGLGFLVAGPVGGVVGFMVGIAGGGEIGARAAGSIADTFSK